MFGGEGGAGVTNKVNYLLWQTLKNVVFLSYPAKFHNNPILKHGKTPTISPGLILVPKTFLVGLFLGQLIFGGGGGGGLIIGGNFVF